MEKKKLPTIDSAARDTRAYQTKFFKLDRQACQKARKLGKYHQKHGGSNEAKLRVLQDQLNIRLRANKLQPSDRIYIQAHVRECYEESLEYRGLFEKMANWWKARRALATFD